MATRTFFRHRSGLAFYLAMAFFVGSVLVSAMAINSHAESTPLRLTGFISVVGGKVLSGDFPQSYTGPADIKDTNCPCYVADWGNAGIYNNDFSLSQESRIGVQANYKFSPEMSVSGQLVSRGTASSPDVQWAYGSYKFNSQWEVQVGRKRIPLYYYSDFQDVGISYPWVSPPPELYGWEATNYNGASVRYSTQIEGANLTSSVFSGSEKVKDSLYQKIYYSGSNQVKWDNVLGGDVEINYEFLTTRLVYVQAKVNTRIFDDAIDTLANLSAYGIAVNLDFDKLFINSEFTQLTRDFTALNYSYKAPALTVGAGWRFGKWTPFLNYAKYTEKTTDLDQYEPQSFKRTSFTVRYDLSSSSDIKAQIDRNTDVTHNFGGDTTVFRLSFDHVFE